jgi:hypothetical protein
MPPMVGAKVLQDEGVEDHGLGWGRGGMVRWWGEG